MFTVFYLTRTNTKIGTSSISYQFELFHEDIEYLSIKIYIFGELYKMVKIFLAHDIA